MELLADTTLLIDLQRDNHAAHRVLAENPTCEFVICIVTVGELVPGFLRLGESVFSKFIQPFPIVPITEKTAWVYGELFAKLKKAGTPIGANDLWIGATALEHRLPVVTRNLGHFRQVRGLEVISY